MIRKSIEGGLCKDRKELCWINRVEYAHVESDLQLPAFRLVYSTVKDSVSHSGLISTASGYPTLEIDEVFHL